MKTTNLKKQRLTQGKDLFGESSEPLLSFFGCGFVGISHSKHDFNLTAFDSDVRKNQFTNMGESIAISNPSINMHSAVFSVLVRGIIQNGSSKYFVKPLNEFFARVIDFKRSVIMRNACFFVTGIVSHNQTSLSINNACKIGNFCNRIRLSFVNTFSHFNSFVKCDYTMHERLIKCLATTTNPENMLRHEVIV